MKTAEQLKNEAIEIIEHAKQEIQALQYPDSHFDEILGRAVEALRKLQNE